MIAFLDLTSTCATTHWKFGERHRGHCSTRCTCYLLAMMDTSDGHARSTADLHVSLVLISLTIGIKIFKVYF